MNLELTIVEMYEKILAELKLQTAELARIRVAVEKK